MVGYTVKQFIETHIDDIEKEDWYHFFREWSSNANWDTDVEDLREFFSTMQRVGLTTIKEDTLGSRLAVFLHDVTALVDELTSQAGVDGSRLYYEAVLEHPELQSKLGLTDAEQLHALMCVDLNGVMPREHYYEIG